MALVFPAALFMTALFIRNIQPPPYQPAQSARYIVDWFSARPHLGLAILLIAFPLGALALGSAAVVRWWGRDEELRQACRDGLALVRKHLAVVAVAGCSLISGAILAVVLLHILTD